MSVFGFGNDSEEDDEEYDSSLPTYAAQPPVTPPQPIPAPMAVTALDVDADKAALADVAREELPAEAAAETPAADTETKDTPKQLTDTELPSDLFDAVIELFNETQPDFVKKCLSHKAQRAYIINSISENLRRRISQAIGPTEAERLKKRVKWLENEVQNTKTLRQENRKLNLSIERQKRALLDRINDLETQVSKHHEEKEKFLSAKYIHDDQSASAPSAAERTATPRGEVITITEHKNILEEHKNIIAGRDARITELNKTVEELKEQLTARSSQCEQLEVKARMSDVMINDLRNKAASERNEYEDTCRQQEIALEQIQQQVANFEQVKARLENRIIELKEALKEEKRAEREAQIARLNDENASLRHTIENNLYNQANSETRLRNEIKQLKLELEKAVTAAGTASHTAIAEPADTAAQEDALGEEEMFSPERRPKQPKRRGRPRKVKLDDELDNTDWFAGHKDDPDFGYHEPPRRPANDNEAQLSLF